MSEKEILCKTQNIRPRAASQEYDARYFIACKTQNIRPRAASFEME